MNYKGSKELCLALKKNIYKLNNHQRMQILLSVISEIPDSLSLIGQMGLIDPDRVRVLLTKGATGYTICQALLNMVEVKAPDSDELSLKVYGYVKPITPVQLRDGDTRCVINDHLGISDNTDAFYDSIPVRVRQVAVTQLLSVYVGLHGQHTVNQLLLGHLQTEDHAGKSLADCYMVYQV